MTDCSSLNAWPVQPWYTQHSRLRKRLRPTQPSHAASHAFIRIGAASEPTSAFLAHGVASSAQLSAISLGGHQCTSGGGGGGGGSVVASPV